jgi:hypothetical protein
MPTEIFELMELFPQTSQRESVQYLPGRRFRPPAGGDGSA